MKELKERFYNCQDLPSLPAVALQLLELCREEDIDLKRAGDLIGRDPALTAKVLSVVNSPFYGLRRQVSSLTHAFALLGVEAVRIVALSFSLAPCFQSGNRQGFSSEQFWKRSVISAVAARSTGIWRDLSCREELFLAALLQDIGVLAMREVLADTYGTLEAAAGGHHGRLVELELEHLGVDHATVGGWLAEIWSLPEHFREAVHYSHWISSTDDWSRLGDATRAVTLSGALADIWLNPETNWAAEQAGWIAADLFEAGSTDIRWILTRVAKDLPQITAFFEVNLGDQQAIDRVLSRARQVLMVSGLRREVRLQYLEQGAIPEPASAVAGNLDSLTGLYDRSMLEEILQLEFRLAARLRRPVSLILCEIHGSTRAFVPEDSVGQQMVRLVASALSQIRARDVVIRYSPAQFLVILPETSSETAHIVAERLQDQVSSLKADSPTCQDLPYSVCMGVACSELETADWKTVLEQALTSTSAPGKRNDLAGRSDGSSMPGLIC